MNVAQLFFGFSGRINRAKYWLGILVYVIIALIMASLGYAADQTTPFQLLSLIINIGVFISGLALGIKRLHDRDKSGWWLLLFYMLPSALFGLGALIFLYGVGSEAAGGLIIGVILYVLGLAALVWAIVELGFLRGTLGPNRYGPDPLTAAA